MMLGLAIVLEANILIRFAIGRQVPRLLARYASTVNFLAPDTAFGEARRNLPAILRARGHARSGEAATLAALDAAAEIIAAAPASSYEPMRAAVWARIGARDPDDWPVMACAQLLNCPIWTEDRDFFGTGVATWTTALVELYFTQPDPDPGTAEH
jgi:predicted nucleic acid-binding protein